MRCGAAEKGPSKKYKPYMSSVFVPAEIQLKSARKLFIFRIHDNIDKIKVPQKKWFDFDNESTGHDVAVEFDVFNHMYFYQWFCFQN